MGLIGNYQSTVPFHAHAKNNISSENRIENISETKVKQLLKEFHQIIVKYSQKSKKHDGFLDVNFNIDTDYCLKTKNNKDNSHIFEIQLKTSKVRNKDHLNDFV